MKIFAEIFKIPALSVPFLSLSQRHDDAAVRFETGHNQKCHILRVPVDRSLAFICVLSLLMTFWPKFIVESTSENRSRSGPLCSGRAMESCISSDTVKGFRFFEHLLFFQSQFVLRKPIFAVAVALPPTRSSRESLTWQRIVRKKGGFLCE